MDFGRVITAMVTPFDEQARIDWDQTKKLIDYLIEEQQTDSLVICGTTGESPTLTEEEKLALFEFAARQAKGRCRIIAGTGSNDTSHSIHLSRKAEQLGVDGLLLVNPYYNRPTQEGLYQHFKAVAEAVHVPVMIYNIPSRTAVNLSSETTLRLAQIPNITAIKESSGDLAQMTRIIAEAPQGFKLYSGDDDLTLPVLSIGGYGIVSVASHVIGKEIRSMVNAYVNGEVREAAGLHAKLLPIFKGLFIGPNPVPVKYALGLHGLRVGEVRLPLVSLTDSEAKIVADLFSN